MSIETIYNCLVVQIKVKTRLRDSGRLTSASNQNIILYYKKSALFSKTNILFQTSIKYYFSSVK